jgi:hypothetical protein
MNRLASVVVLLGIVALVGCSDWDNPATRVARDIQRIGYGCGDFHPVDTKALSPRRITAAGTCSVRGELVTISVYKSGTALDQDRQRTDAKCRATSPQSRGYLANPYVRTGRSLIEGVFLSVDQPPDVVTAYWAPIANGIAAATHGRVEYANCSTP